MPSIYQGRAENARTRAPSTLIRRLGNTKEERVILTIAAAALIYQSRHTAFPDDPRVVPMTTAFRKANSGMRSAAELEDYVVHELKIIEVLLVGDNISHQATAWRLLPAIDAYFDKHAALIEDFVRQLASSEEDRAQLEEKLGARAALGTPDAVSRLPVNRDAVEQHLASLPALSKRTPEQQRDWAALTYILASLDAGGCWPHAYWVKPEGGRLYTSGMLASIQNLSEEMREVVLKDTGVISVDIKNAHMVLLDSFSRKAGCPEPALRDYVQNRDEVLSVMSRELDISRDTAKSIILAMLCGAKLTGRTIPERLGAQEWPLPPSKKPAFLRRLRTLCPSLVALSEAIDRAVSGVSAYLGIECRRDGHKDPFAVFLHDAERAWVQQFAQDLESKTGSEVVAYLHDEVFIFPLADTDVIHRIAAQVSEKVGVPFCVGVKHDYRGWSPSPQQISQLLALLTERDGKDWAFEGGLLDGIDTEDDLLAEFARISAQLSERPVHRTSRKVPTQKVPAHDEDEEDEETDFTFRELRATHRAAAVHSTA